MERQYILFSKNEGSEVLDAGIFTIRNKLPERERYDEYKANHPKLMIDDESIEAVKNLLLQGKYIDNDIAIRDCNTCRLNGIVELLVREEGFPIVKFNIFPTDYTYCLWEYAPEGIKKRTKHYGSLTPEQRMKEIKDKELQELIDSL